MLTVEVCSHRRTLCGKWPVLNDLLNQWRANGDKVLIFSRSVRMLKAIRQWFEEDHPDFKYLDGGVPQHKRLGLCDEFNNDPNVFSFLISTMAGGVGLNLTAANKVVILDPNCPSALRMASLTAQGIRRTISRPWIAPTAGVRRATSTSTG